MYPGHEYVEVRCFDHPDRVAVYEGRCMFCLIGEVGVDEAQRLARLEREKERNE
jgi:hypothetical protein